jgi:hypothetical protein
MIENEVEMSYPHSNPEVRNYRKEDRLKEAQGTVSEQQSNVR